MNMDIKYCLLENMIHFCGIIYLFILLSYCTAFPYHEPSSSDSQQQRQMPQQQQQQQLTVSTVPPLQNAVLKEQFEGDQQLHAQTEEGKIALAEVEERSSEREETKYDHSVNEEVEELRFPLDAVITQIEQDDFHDQIEHHQQQEHAPLTSSEKNDPKASERAKVPSFQAAVPSSTADEASSSISEAKTASVDLVNEGRTHLDKTTQMEGNKSNAKDEGEQSKKEQINEINDGKGKAENAIEKETLGEEKKGTERQNDENVHAISALEQNKENAVARSMPPIVDVSDIGIASAPSNGGQFSETHKEEEEEKGHNGNEEKDSRSSDGKGTEESWLTWWDKIVLGLRCARHDCRETLIGNNEQRPKVINGWKITRRARSAVEERKGTVQFEMGQFCKCQTKRFQKDPLE